MPDSSGAAPRASGVSVLKFNGVRIRGVFAEQSAGPTPRSSNSCITLLDSQTGLADKANRHWPVDNSGSGRAAPSGAGLSQALPAAANASLERQLPIHPSTSCTVSTRCAPWRIAGWPALGLGVNGGTPHGKHPRGSALERRRAVINEPLFRLASTTSVRQAKPAG